MDDALTTKNPLQTTQYIDANKEQTTQEVDAKKEYNGIYGIKAFTTTLQKSAYDIKKLDDTMLLNIAINSNKVMTMNGKNNYYNAK
jgi:hypothetical protein